MKINLWAAMQPLDVLEQVERMIPDIVSERDFEEIRRRKLRSRQGRAKGRQDKQGFSFWRAVGAVLVFIGICMLFPGPSDIAVAGTGFALGITLGLSLAASFMMAVAFVVATYLIAMTIIAIGSWLLTVG